MTIEIGLTAHQWLDIKRIVGLGAHAERRISPPIEIINGDTKVEIEADGTAKITLSDPE